MRRAVAVLASLGLGLGTIALSSPVQAATTVTVTVTEVSSTLLGLMPSMVTASQVTFDNRTASDISFSSSTFSSGGVACAPCVVTANTDATFTVESDGFVTVQQVGTSRSQGLIVTYEAPSPGPTPGSGSSDAAPAPVMQQFGLPASGNCEDGYSDSMDWSGVGSSGWGVSWAQWMNDGSGGVVCSRTVMYDTSTAKWTVN